MLVSNQSEAVDTALSRGSVNASVNTTNIMMIPAEPKKITGEVRRRIHRAVSRAREINSYVPSVSPLGTLNSTDTSWPIHLAGSF